MLNKMSAFLIIINIIFAVIIGNILCADINNKNTRQNAWYNSTNSQNFNAQHFGVNSAITPWPTLGAPKYQLTQQANFPALARSPMWVRPNNSVIWVRNNSPQQNFNYPNNVHTHTSNFLTNERGRGNGERPNLSENIPKGNSIKSPEVNGLLSTGSAMRQNESFNTLNVEVSDNELREFSEELFNKESNSPNQYVTVNFQGMTSSRSTNDEAPLPLLTINQAAYSFSTISKLLPLYDNYIVEANRNEIYTAQEKNEENDLLNAVISTPVMQHTRNFLISKGKIGRDPQEFKELLQVIWFHMYSRGKGRIGSSGFEHVFLAELKNNQVSGLHNWLYFSEGEKRNEINYLGYMKKIELGGKGFLLKFHFTFQGVDKPVDSMFIGTTPELEMALYSACFVLRADRICPLKLNGNRFIIRTYTYRYRGNNMIGSAFPEI